MDELKDAPLTREAIRMLHDGELKDVQEMSEDHNYDFLNYLVVNKYAETDGRDVKLTEKGNKAYRQIMRSGDGPELLKQMFQI